MNPSRRAFGALVLASAALGPLGAAAETVEVVMRDYQFVPAVLQVKAGTTVRWVNREKRTTHSVLFTGPAGFEGERIFPDESWQRRFDAAGDFPYTCGPHPEMKGRIEVVP